MVLEKMASLRNYVKQRNCEASRRRRKTVRSNHVNEEERKM